MTTCLFILIFLLLALSLFWLYTFFLHVLAFLFRLMFSIFSTACRPDESDVKHARVTKGKSWGGGLRGNDPPKALRV